MESISEMYCLERHHACRADRSRWPSQVDLQRETNVAASKHLRQSNPRHRYPYHPKKYRTVCWPAQAGSLVWRVGYELHIVVPTVPQAEAAIPSTFAVQGAVDL